MCLHQSFANLEITSHLIYVAAFIEKNVFFDFMEPDIKISMHVWDIKNSQATGHLEEKEDYFLRKNGFVKMLF